MKPLTLFAACVGGILLTLTWALGVLSLCALTLPH